MITRLRRYRDNLGVVNTVLGVLFVGYIAWRMLQMSSVSAMVLYASFALFLLILPLALMPLLVPRPQFAARCIKYGQYAIYGVVILSILNLVAIPPVVGLAIIMAIFFYMGLVFWFYSSPHIMTADGHQRWVERAERDEKAVLIEAITRDQQLLDEDQA